MSPFLGVSGLGGPGSLIGASLPGTNLSENYWYTALKGTSINGYTMAVDDVNGNVFFAGGYAGAGTGDTAIIGKLNIDGSFAWARSFVSDGGGSEYFMGADCDSEGNVYAVGYCTNTSSTFTNGGTDAILVKYDTDGNLQWQRALGYNGNDRGYEIHVDSSDNIFIVGITDQSGNTYVLVAKYNTSGTLQWQNSFGDSIGQYGYGITTDSSGNLYVCGPYFTSDRKTSVFKLNSSGTVQWARQITNPTTSGDVFGTNIAVDSSGNVYVLMNGEGSGFNSEWRLVKLDTSQNIAWERNFDSTYSAEATSVRIDSGGNIIVCGYANNTTGEPYLTAVKYNSSGTLQWQRVVYDSSSGSARGGYTYDGEIDREGNVYVVGTVQPYGGGVGIGIIKMPSDGTLTGTYTEGSYSATFAASSYNTSTSQSTITIASYTPTSVTPTLTNKTSALTSSTVASGSGTNELEVRRVTIQ